MARVSGSVGSVPQAEAETRSFTQEHAMDLLCDVSYGRVCTERQDYADVMRPPLKQFSSVPQFWSLRWYVYDIVTAHIITIVKF